MEDGVPGERLQLPKAREEEMCVINLGSKRLFAASPAAATQGGTKRHALGGAGEEAETRRERWDRNDEASDEAVPSIVISEPTGAEGQTSLTAEEARYLASLSELSIEAIEGMQRLYMVSRTRNLQDSAMAGLYRKRPRQVMAGLFGRVLDLLSPPEGQSEAAIFSVTAKKSVLAVLWLLHTILLHFSEEGGGDSRLCTLQVGSIRSAQLLRQLESTAMDMAVFEVVESNGLLAVSLKETAEEASIRAWSLRAALLCASLRLVRSTIADWDVAGSAAVVLLVQLLLRLDALYRWHLGGPETSAECLEAEAKPWRGKASEFISVQKTMRGANTVFEELFNDRRLYKEEVPVRRHGEVLRHIRSLFADTELLHRMRNSGVRIVYTVSSFYGQQLEQLPEVTPSDVAAARSVAHCLSQALSGLPYKSDAKEMTAVLLLLKRLSGMEEPSLAEILLPHVLEFSASSENMELAYAEILAETLLSVPCNLGSAGIRAILALLRAVGKASAGCKLYAQAIQVLIQQVNEYQNCFLADVCTSSELLDVLQERLKEAATAAETLRLLVSLVSTNRCCMFNLIDNGLVCVVLCSKSLVSMSRAFSKMHTLFCSENAQQLEWRVMTAAPPSAVFTAMCMRMAEGPEKFERLLQRTGALRKFERYLVVAQSAGHKAANERQDAYCQSVAALLLQDLAGRYAADYWRAERTHLERALEVLPHASDRDEQVKRYRTGLSGGDVMLYAPDSTEGVSLQRTVLEANAQLSELLHAKGEKEGGYTTLRLQGTTRAALVQVVRALHGMRSFAIDSALAAAVLELCCRFDMTSALRLHCVQVLFEDMPDGDLCKCYHIARQWNDRLVKLCCLRNAIGRMPSILLHRKLNSWPVSLRSQLVADCCELVRALLP